jgi:predicted nucleic acid-binding protein
MAYLLDTNILVRLANAADAQHAVVARAVIELHRQGEPLHLTGQILIEFRNVATRPKAQNGLGLSVQETEAQAAGFETSFTLLEDTSAIFPTWKGLVGALGIVGKQVHDARLVAVCHAHRMTHLLTINVADFNTMATYRPGLVVVNPADV